MRAQLKSGALFPMLAVTRNHFGSSALATKAGVLVPFGAPSKRRSALKDPAKAPQAMDWRPAWPREGSRDSAPMGLA